MRQKANYSVTLRGPLPKDLVEKLSLVHAQAIRESLHRLAMDDHDQTANPERFQALRQTKNAK